MRGLAIGVAQYSNDYGCFPFSAYGVTPYRPTWPMLISPYLQLDTTNDRWAPGEFKIFACPSNKTAPEAWLSANNHFAQNSYCVNIEVMDRVTLDANADGRYGGVIPGKIIFPSKTIMFAENHSASNSVGCSTENAKCYNSGYYYEYTVSGGTIFSDPGKRGYHMKFNNWAFCDSHIESLNWEDTVSSENLWKLNK
jgi:hypothetical protein